MPQDADQPPERPFSAAPAEPERLDSWKEIAAFLQRDVRTVQRWEKQAGLPVHRHAQSRLRTAYAYRSELEAWWHAQRPLVEPAAESAADSSVHTAEIADSTGLVGSGTIAGIRRFSPRRLFAAGVLSAAALVAIAAVVGRRSTVDAPASPAIPPISVLVTRFEDQAGDALMASAIEEAVARQIGGRSYLEPVAPSRVTRALRLMRRETGPPVTEALGREIALRDGRIKYVVSGRIHRLKSRFFADVRAIQPADGRVRINLEWQGSTLDELLSRSEREARRLADLVGEGAAAAPAVDLLEPVTSASTAAVRLYTAAVQAGSRGQWGASELLARRAIGADGDFAAAYAWTGWSVWQQRRPAGDCVPLLERAVALASSVTDREAYLISGTLQTVTGDLRQAASAMEAALRLDPRDRLALDLLIHVYWRAGRVKRAVDLSVARAENYPEDFYATVRAAHALGLGRRHRDRAAAFADRARELALASPQAVADHPSWHAWLQVLPVYQLWMTGDSRGGLEQLAVLERGLGDRLGRERDAFAGAVGFAALAFGRSQQAERAFRHGSRPERQINQAMLALSRGDEEQARQWLRQVREHAALRPALFARLGFDAEALAGLDAALPSGHAEGLAAVTRGLLAASKGQSDGAAEALRHGAQLLRASGEPEYFFALEALARMASARGAGDQAVRLLSEAAAERAHTYGPAIWTGVFWARLSRDLVALLRQQDRHEEADRIDAELRSVLSDADLPAPSIAKSVSVR